MNGYQIRMEQTLRHSFLYIAGEETERIEDGGNKMLLHVRVPGTLPVSLQQEEEERLCYDTSAVSALDTQFAKQMIQEAQLVQLVESLSRVLESLDEFILSEDHLFLRPETVFYDEGKEQFLFILYPERSGCFQEEIRELFQWILKHIDYHSDGAILLAYRLAQLAARDHFQLWELGKAVQSGKRRALAEGKNEETLSLTSLLEAEQEDKEEKDPVFRFSDIAGPSRIISAQEDEKKQEAQYLPESEEKKQDGMQGTSAPIFENADNGTEIREEDYLLDPEREGAISGSLGDRVRTWRARFGKQVLGVFLMILLPLIVYLWQGPETFRAILPLIGIAEAGILVILVASILMKEES